ncbi:G2/mitotic-specific cyclin [Binucleata daphniae]
MTRIPLQDKKNIIGKNNTKSVYKNTNANNNTNSNDSYTSFIRLRHLTDKLSVQFYTDNLKSTIKHYKNEQKHYCTKVIASKNRTKLIEWLITVHHKLHLSDETLYLTVNIIDRMFLLRNIPNEKLPLLTVSSLFIASKYEEVTPPSLQTFISLLNDQSENVLQAEKYLLSVLDYRIDYPQPLNFIRHCNKADNYNMYVRKMSKVILECSLMSDKISSLRGSVKANAAYLIARNICKITKNEDVFWFYCDENIEDVLDCVNLYVEHLKHGIGESIIRKYRNSDVIQRIIDFIENT